MEWSSGDGPLLGGPKEPPKSEEVTLNVNPCNAIFDVS